MTRRASAFSGVEHAGQLSARRCPRCARARGRRAARRRSCGATSKNGSSARAGEQVAERLHDQCAQRGGELLHRVPQLGIGARRDDQLEPGVEGRPRHHRPQDVDGGGVAVGSRRAPGRTPRETRGSGARRGARPRRSPARPWSESGAAAHRATAPRDARSPAWWCARSPRSHRHSIVASSSRARGGRGALRLGATSSLARRPDPRRRSTRE